MQARRWILCSHREDSIQIINPNCFWSNLITQSLNLHNCSRRFWLNHRMSKEIKYPSRNLLEIQPLKAKMSESSNNISISSFNVSALKEIPKLSTGNLVSWKQGLKIHLKINGLYSFVEREQIRPTSMPECDAFDMPQAAVLNAIQSTIDDAKRTSIDSMDIPRRRTMLSLFNMVRTMALLLPIPSPIFSVQHMSHPSQWTFTWKGFKTFTAE